jgi:hypothetical protein
MNRQNLDTAIEIARVAVAVALVLLAVLAGVHLLESLAWNALTAAWMQAGFSVLAIFVAAGMPLWIHLETNRRERRFRIWAARGALGHERLPAAIEKAGGVANELLRVREELGNGDMSPQRLRPMLIRIQLIRGRIEELMEATIPPSAAAVNLEPSVQLQFDSATASLKRARNEALEAAKVYTRIADQATSAENPEIGHVRLKNAAGQLEFAITDLRAAQTAIFDD